MQNKKLIHFLRVCHNSYQKKYDPSVLHYRSLHKLAKNGGRLMENITTETNQLQHADQNCSFNAQSIASSLQRITQPYYTQKQFSKLYTKHTKVLNTRRMKTSYLKEFRLSLRIHYLKFHNQKLIQLYQQLDHLGVQQNNDDNKDYMISQLIALINKDSKHIYSYLQFLNFCTFCTNQEIEQYFGVRSKHDIDEFIFDIQYENKFLLNMKEFRACTIFNQYVEFSRIQIGPIGTFLENNIFSNVFLNIDNRIQLITSWSSFIIVRCVSTGQMYVGYEETTQFYDQLNDDLYDVIIIGITNISERIWQLKIRYLNYYYKGINEIQVSLSHPSELRTLAIHKVKINNLNQCVCLKNFYTSFNSYNEDDLIGLTQLARIFSKHDKYTGNYTSLLEQIMIQNNNVIEYVNIRKGNGTVSSQEFSLNFPLLRYFNVEFNYIQNNNKIRFTFNQSEMPFLQFAHASNGSINFNNNKSPMTLSQCQHLNRIKNKMNQSNNDTNIKLLNQLQQYIYDLKQESVTCQLYLGRIY